MTMVKKRASAASRRRPVDPTLRSIALRAAVVFAAECALHEVSVNNANGLPPTPLHQTGSEIET